MSKVGFAVLLAGSLLQAQVAQPPQGYSCETSYKGRKLDGQVYLCKSDQVVSAGIRSNGASGPWIEVVDVSKQKNVTTWRIMLRGNRADVVAFTGATQILEAPTEFSVQRAPASVLLTHQGEPLLGAGVFSESITIDLATSSFVYSGQSANLLMNKTNVFVGSCAPYL
jgi:hypothetical protein